MNNDIILMGHGSGGILTHELIEGVFHKYFSNEHLDKQSDSSILAINSKNIAFTTDSFVVSPIFFPGGNIGKLAVAGTVNDLAVSGAIPKYLSCSFIIEEGLEIAELEKIVKSMAEEAKKANVSIVTGDTKVVARGQCDKIYINTTGIGEINEERKTISFADNIQDGDLLVINGNIGEHALAIASQREGMQMKINVESDCACLNDFIDYAMKNMDIKFMRDCTRGGLATVLSELAKSKDMGIDIQEDALPISETVNNYCDIFGFDPLYLANEGKVLMLINKNDEEKISLLKNHPLGKNSRIIGMITKEHNGMVVMKTSIGGSRIIDMLASDQLPRIC